MGKCHAGAAIIFVVVSIAMTWPLARNLERAVAYPGDPYINIWILDWDHYATFRSPLSLFEANAFHPARYPLAYSENLYGIALLLIPFRLAGIGPITAYNLAMLGGFAFSGFAAYLLGQRLTGSFVAGLAAGVFYAFVPFRFTHLSHLQHVWGGWIPILLLTLIWYVELPSWRRAGVFGAVFVMNGLTNIHWFLFGSFAVAITAALFAAGGVRSWKKLLIAAVAALLLLVPFLYPYWAVAKFYETTRDWSETKALSATLADWLVSNFHTRLYGALRNPAIDPERWLFPGALSMVLATAAVLAFRRNPRAVLIGAVWVVIGLAGSMGLNFFFHTFLYDAVPGFKAVRAPARWAAIAYVGISILVAVTTTVVAKRIRWMAWVIPFAFMTELRAAPIRWYQVIPEPPKVYTWLASQPLRGAVLELPIDIAGSEYIYLLRATIHHKKLVNGVSGFTPPETADLTAMWKRNPIPEDFTSRLRGIGVGLIIVHLNTLGQQESATREWLQREMERGAVSFVGRFDAGLKGDWVFSLERSEKPTGPLARAFVEGKTTYNSSTFGYFHPPGNRLHGSAFFAGWALSPHGIRSVDLLFNNGGIRLPAILVPDPDLHRVFPWYPNCPKPRFMAHFKTRPKGVWRDTDVQVEIVDGRGRRARLEDYWFTWQ